MKKFLISMIVALSVGMVSVHAVAESDPGRITYQPVEAIDLVTGKIKIAIDAITSGSDAEVVTNLIKDALDISKEINANDKVDSARAKANAKLKSARNHAKNSSLQEAEQELKSAVQSFEDLKKLL